MKQLSVAWLILRQVTVTECLGQLRAKEDLHRQAATLILKNLAHQCSDPGALEELINFLFAVLNGMTQCTKILLAVMLLYGASKSLQSFFLVLTNFHFLLMLQFLVSNAINTPIIKSNKHALYGINGGKPLCNRCDRRTSIAWPNTKLISPVVDSALDRTKAYAS